MFAAHLSVSIKSLTRCKQKVVLAAMLEGKSMPSKRRYDGKEYSAFK